jgi:hypothetical protein
VRAEDNMALISLSLPSHSLRLYHQMVEMVMRQQQRLEFDFSLLNEACPLSHRLPFHSTTKDLKTRKEKCIQAYLLPFLGFMHTIKRVLRSNIMTMNLPNHPVFLVVLLP